MDNTALLLSSIVPSPCYVIEEEALCSNLSIIKKVATEAKIEIILALKAFAMWKTFPIIAKYVSKTTASSLSEARMSVSKFGSKAHLYAPIYADEEFDELMELSSHISFNSLAQFEKYSNRALAKGISLGLRINPEVSVVETDLYNPAKKGSRLGITAQHIPQQLPKGVEGLHFHTLCENNSFDLEKVLLVVSQKFDQQLKQVKWLNMGGGHLMTRKGYNIHHLIEVINAFRQRYPHLHIILEPGSAFAWQTGTLKARIEDIVENNGIKTAMLNISFACHLPDCLEMPYQPIIRGANIVEKNEPQPDNCYRMGGNSCLSGDFIGDWQFNKPLKVGDSIIFEDMIHYTTVKTTMFNGVSHPSIGIIKKVGEFELLKKFTPDNYIERMC